MQGQQGKKSEKEELRRWEAKRAGVVLWTQRKEHSERVELSVLTSAGKSVRKETELCFLEVTKRLASAGAVRWYDGHRREEG